MKNLFGTSQGQGESEWISVSDLMSGLMVIFLFIAIVYIRPLVEQKERAIQDKEELAAVQQTIKEIAVAWSESEVSIYEELQKEFERDLERWNAELEKETLTIRFRAPDVLFDRNRADLKPEFQNIISDFFPRYVRVLSQFEDAIDEVRIEGHTSSEWNVNTSPVEAYFNNMELSQARTRAVLEYALKLDGVEPFRLWCLSHVTANGLSSSRLVSKTDGSEDANASRRVEFRVRTNAKEQIVKVVETIQ
ncbi:OmpA family protein [Rhodobacterales bacterium]|nr:OmpA family protein [Rhodobacterales bacterium]